MSKIYLLKKVQTIPADIDTVWDFFTTPANLAAITPASLDFKIISKLHRNKIYPGQIIEYKVKPLGGISVYWMTEITHVKEKEYFVDEQRHGPYSLWHHEHHFRIIKGGVEMTDMVHYKIPLWFLGDVINSLFVQAQLEKIFDFRFQAVEKRFGKWKQ